MSIDALIDRLAALPVLKDVPRNELAWPAERATVETLEVGSPLVENNPIIERMIVMFEGRAGLYVPAGGGRRKLVEATAGQIVGILPYSRLQRAPGETVVEEPITMFAVHRDQLD